MGNELTELMVKQGKCLTELGELNLSNAALFGTKMTECVKLIETLEDLALDLRKAYSFYADMFPINEFAVEQSEKQSEKDSRYYKNISKLRTYTTATCEQGILKVKTFPLIKNVTRKTKRYIFDEIVRAINESMKLEERPLYVGHTVVVIESKAINEMSMNDNDNVEVSAIINSLKAFFLPDDDPIHLSVFRIGTQSDEPSTEIFLVPFEKFPSWLIEKKYSVK